jgi:hypothetical protein
LCVINNAVVLDTFGKPASGMIQGNIKWFGKVDDCNGDYVNEISVMGLEFNTTYQASYCQLVVRLPGLPTGRVPLVQYVSRLYWGLCLPKSCAEQFQFKGDYYGSIFEVDDAQAGFGIDAVRCLAVAEEKTQMSSFAIAVMYV